MHVAVPMTPFTFFFMEKIVICTDFVKKCTVDKLAIIESIKYKIASHVIDGEIKFMKTQFCQ